MVLGVAGSIPVSHPLSWENVLRHYDLSGPVTVTPVGGTAAPSVRVVTTRETMILRRRPTALARPEFIDFDHALKQSLADRHFPAPRPVPTRTGQTWVRDGEDVYEMSRLLQGERVPVPNPRQLYETGRTLARFHLLAAEFRHPGKDHFVREDHVSILQPLLEDLYPLAPAAEFREELDFIRAWLHKLHALAGDGAVTPVEEVIIHGDFHPGNVLYSGYHVSAVLDYDYAAPGSVLRDIGDGLMFFAATRGRPFDPDDIWSLAQAWQPDSARAMEFLKGYAAVRPLPEDWPMTSYVLLARWLQVKLHGARKVPPDRKLDFVLTDLRETVHWLENGFQGWFIDLVMAL